MFGLVRKAVLFVAVATGGTVLIFVGKSYWNKIRENPIINIDVNNPTPNVNIENIIDNVSPWKKPPKYVAYTAEETKNFKTENLALASDIQAWYSQAKLSPSRAFNALFHGTPMTGKTSLARQLAKEAGLPLVAVKGSDLQDRIYEQRTILDKFRALLEDLKTNPKTAGQNYILFIDEADKVGDGLNFVKDTLAEIDNQNWPNNLWIFATNYIEKIDEAVYENRERMRYKLDFSWTKNIFLLHALQKGFEFLINDTFFSNTNFNSSSFYNNFASTSSLCDDIYVKFNFETLNILVTRKNEFLASWEQILQRFKVKTHNNKLVDAAVVTTAYNAKWKMAIGELYPQVQTLEMENTSGLTYASKKMQLAVFEYSLDLFWKAYKNKRLNENWYSLSNHSNYLKWALSRGYSLGELGINIYSERDNGGALNHKAKFLSGY